MLKRSSNNNIDNISNKLKVNKIIANVLVNRGIEEIEEAQRFLKPSIEELNDPFLMKDMNIATDIIIKGIQEGKSILVYGDYDVDGVTSTTILYKALKRCGAKVSYHVPERENEGYGMNSERIKRLGQEGVDIIISCDNGISAAEQVKLAKDLGMTVIITDHHEVPVIEDADGNMIQVLPEADAVINPKQKDCNYPFKLLCGAGIAFKFVKALYKKMKVNQEEALEFIEIACIGTICDVVDLVGENRIIAKNGLNVINDTKNTGLRALIEVLGIKDKKIGSRTIGFQIGPCINATGRLETAAVSVELFLCEDPAIAVKLAEKLNELNKARQDITTSNIEEIIMQVEDSSLKNDKVLVVYNKNVHESVAGIVAGRVRERYNVPTIVITKGKEMPKGSGRSIDEYNLFKELSNCKDLLERFGGHPMAAGLSIKEENIEMLRKELNDNCTLTDDDIIPKIRIDRQVKLNEISLDLIKELEVLEPFGKGNEAPTFAEKNIKVNRIYIIGKDSNTLKLSCSIPGTYGTIDAIAFGKADSFKEMLSERYGEDSLNVLRNPLNLRLDIVFYPSINEYKGEKKVQLRIIDFRISS